MPRLTEERAACQAEQEDVRSCLGNALVYLKLVDLRIRLAAGSQPDLLAPVCEDLLSAWELIRRAQGLIKGG